MDTRREFNTQDNEQPVEEGSNSKPDDHAEMSKELEPCDSSDRSMDPSLTIVLFGNSSSIQFGHENILLGEKQMNTENAEISSIVPLQRKISEHHVSVINLTGLHENDHVDHLTDQLVNENEIHAFIFVVQLGQLTDADKMGLKWVQRVFGDKVLQFVTILFTYESEEEYDTVIDDLKKNPVLEKLLEKCGGGYQTCEKMMKKQSEMIDLMNKIENNQQCYTREMYNTKLREREDLQNRESGAKMNDCYFNNQDEETEEKTIYTAKSQPLCIQSEKGEIQMAIEHPINSPETCITEATLSDPLVAASSCPDEETEEKTIYTAKSQPLCIQSEKGEIQMAIEHPINSPETCITEATLSDPLVAASSCPDEHTINKEIMEHTATSQKKERHVMRILVRMLNVLWSIAAFLIIIFMDCVKQLKKVIFEKVLSIDGKTLGQDKEEKNREKVENLFNKLNLEDQHDKLGTGDFLQLTEHSFQTHESCAEKELVQTFTQKLLMMNYRARNIKTNEQTNELIPTLNTNDSHENQADDADILKEMSLSTEEKRNSYPVNPMDVQMAVFHCADGFLKQLMVTKLSQCQYALPLLVPDPLTQKIEFPLWTFRQINKSWKMRNTNNEIISQIKPIYKAETPMVFFFRFGSVSSSKSQLMNRLINERHNTFFHRNCPGSSRSRVLMDGVVEIAWFCPSGKNTDKFTDCVAFCNLHGDAGDHEKQLQILSEMASVNVVLLPQLQKNDRSMMKVQELYKDSKPLICLLTEDVSTVIKTRKGKYKIGLKDRNQSDVSEELRRAINDCLSESPSMFRLEDVSNSKHSDIRVDEEDDDDCRRGRGAAQQMIRLLEKKDLTEIKESFLPCQGKLWHQWCQKNKELHRLQADEIEKEISTKQNEMKKIREQQHESDISVFMKHFIKQMNSRGEHKMMYFLKWLRILLDEYTSADLSALHHKYNEKWSTVLKLKENHNKSNQLKAEQTELEKISEELQDATFGLEHIMREIGQIYESCSSVMKDIKDMQYNYMFLPSLAAEMMTSGFPLELMDGDAAHVPLLWISAVIDELILKLGNQTRVFVLSVLGIQSSGKSTMLNAMFGLQFAVSAGRCTRGAFMQLVRVSDEMKTQMNIDYILVVDTEGLRALELAGRSTRHHDNEMATFVVGLGNMTLINIFGENPAEMQDILQIVVQAFLRMKKVRLNPSCVFVHQNVSDVTAGEKNMEGRRRLQETLDEMTKLASKEEVCDEECFSDVIAFDVQNDVKYIAHLWEGSPPMAPPNPDYCENIQQLKKTIMSHASDSDGMLLINLKERIKDLWEALLNERFVFSFRNSLEIAVYRKLETEYSKWSWSLRSAMMKTENKLHNNIENKAIHEVNETDLQRDIKKTREEVKTSMSEFFEKDKDKDILIQWKTSFDIKIKDVHENIVRETKRKLNEILQQRDLKKKIDDQRTHHENTLFEKSKELALKLRDKANDEETLKKEFDLFWKQWMKVIIRDTPAIKDIDIMRDVREILSDVYESVGGESSEYNNIFTVPSYSDYVIFKKSTKTGIRNVVKGAYRTVKETLGYPRVLTPENEAQIRSLVTDVALETDRMIQSSNISKMGYNISCIQLLTDYIKAKILDHQEGLVKYKFKNEFFIDLVLSICKKTNKMITDQYKSFREANDPVLYLEKKREEYYSIFQKYCHGATSAAIFGEIICQKLKEPIEQSVNKQTARDLADEMRTNCPSLNGNRSNLEKHMLKTLAEKGDFNKYINYIQNPRDHFKRFIGDEVSQYITDKFSVSVLPKMKENIELLQQKIMKAAHESTEHVQANKGDVDLWLKSFTQQLSDELIFSEKDLSGVKHDDVDDFNLLEDIIRQELPVVMSDISGRFKMNSFPANLDYKDKPDKLLIDHLCQCCWVQCPFCGAICTNTIENHEGDHSVSFHRNTGLNGMSYRGTTNLSISICTSAVASNRCFYPKNEDDAVLWREYRSAGGEYANWKITSDLSELPYWKWFVCRFQKNLENYYDKTFEGSGEIPEEWRNYSKNDAFESLDKYI